MRIKLKHVSSDVDRHGNVRYYFRRPHQKKIRLRGAPGSEIFMHGYQLALRGVVISSSSLRPVAASGSLRELVEGYYRSAEFKFLAPRTQRVRRRILDNLCAQDGDKPFGLLEPRHVRSRRDERSDLPEAANALVKALRRVFAFAVENDLANRNPAKEVSLLRSGTEGFHSWTIDEIRQFEERHPVGTRARLALALLLYTGQRRSDIISFGWPNVKDGWLVFTQAKNRTRRPVTLSIPIRPELTAIIEATQNNQNTFLATEFGKPFSPNGFGNWFRARCDEANLPNCSAHGLRKAAAARLAELGAGENEIMAVTGHSTSKEIVRYTRGARQRVLAARAMARFANDQSLRVDVPLSVPEERGGTKIDRK